MAQRAALGALDHHDRGRLIRSVGQTQTFLSAVQAGFALPYTPVSAGRCSRCHAVLRVRPSHLTGMPPTETQMLVWALAGLRTIARAPAHLS